MSCLLVLSLALSLATGAGAVAPSTDPILLDRNAETRGVSAGLRDLAVRSVEFTDRQLRFQVGDRTLEATTMRPQAHTNGDVSLTLAPGEDAQILGGQVTLGASGVFGQIQTRDGQHLLRTDASGTWWTPIPSHGVEINRCGMGDHDHDHHHTLFAGRKKGSLLRSPMGTEQDGTTVIDLLIIYNDALARRYPGDLLSTRLNHLVAIANQILGNSGLDAVIRLVGSQAVDYRNDNSNFDFRNDIALTLGGDEQPGLAGVRERRDALGADLVIGLRPHDIETRGSCGIAFFPENDAIFGVNVVSDGVSSWSFCLDDVLTHEIGHNLGATHQVGAGGGAIDPTGAAFVQPGRFITVMGSFGTGRPDRFRSLPTFSNPFLPCGGEPCGSETDANNFGVIRQFIASVAGYRPSVSNATPPDAPGRTDSDQDGDGVTDWQDALPFDPTETEDRDRDGRGDNADRFPADPQEQDDADLDGIGDRADLDDDGDGTPDELDAFPLDAGEQDDSDRDGIGDRADRFNRDPDEFRDTDGDGIGDNEDRDDDDDGVEEFDGERQDLLVVSVDNRRILRFDATTGAPRGVEIPPWDSRLTFQTRMAWRQSDSTLLYTGDSGVRRASLLDRTLLGEWVPAYNDEVPTAAQLRSGFPVGLATLDGGRRVLASRLNSPLLETFGGREQARSELNINWQLDPQERPGSAVSAPEGVYVLGLETRSIYVVDGLGPRVLAGPALDWMRDPRYLAVTDDDRLLVSDPGRNTVVAVDRTTGAFLGDLAELGPAGFDRPSGIAVTRDRTLLVGASRQGAILAFDVDSGAFEGVRTQGSGLAAPGDLLLVPSLQDRFPRDPQRQLKPNPGLWSDPASDGRGFDIQVFGNRLSVIWYTYDDTGAPTWYLAAGELEGERFSAPLQRFTLAGGSPESTEAPVSEIVGSLELRFSSERAATLQWRFGDLEGEERLSWLVFTPRLIQQNPTGLWGRQDGPGWGVSLASQGGRTVAVAFLYDAEGTPRWAISAPVQGVGPYRFDMSAGFAPGLCPGCSPGLAPSFQDAGTMRLDTGAQAQWDSAITWPAPLTGVWNLDGTPVRRFSEPTERPR